MPITNLHVDSFHEKHKNNSVIKTYILLFPMKNES